MAIVEIRTYTIRVGLVAEYLALYHAEGYGPHCRHLGEPIAWFQSEVGDLNQVMMLWRYADHADRERRRAALYADAAWLAFIPKTRTYIEKMENRIVQPTFFSPLQ